MNKNTKKLIVKFLTKEANFSELQQLELWISDPKNEILFFEFIKTNAFTNKAVSKYNTKNAKKVIVQRIRQEKHKFNNILKYAVSAIFIGTLASSYFLIDNIFDKDVENNTPTIVNTKIEPGTTKATLTLEDGTNVILEKGKQYILDNLKSNGEDLVYTLSQTDKPKLNSNIAYNYLTIPRGGQYHVKLSDGTEIWLNSESQLKYPTSFIDGESRIVELVYGEAYFDVSPSSKHKGANFLVQNQSQDVEVLGTEFNIKAYRDDLNIYTTLVEGKVTIDNGVSKQNLVPSQQSNLDIESNRVTVAIVDVGSEISWKNGIFSFKGKTLKNIMKVISRWYNVDVIFENKDLESLKFKGVLSKDQSIEEVLSIMKSSTISDYKIMDKVIILK